ncbi:multidrug effflux MFS transporter [Shimia thalassica]|uniref:multidrug effflux MFS transporter n=1 Tax=Shimia thalassica TaxID=1715693 RepID=UPI0027360DDB|nr:multidrug effflux MFS transporter [Shimia thalassica]MDP2580890.1 multidrug effflux MFS transporter [Shimia thalassica]
MSKSAFDRSDAMIFFGGITGLTAISIDIVLPATGLIARDFGVPDAMGSLLIGAYFIAYAIGQLFWGLFSDAFGRRLALILSLVGFTAATVACAMAPSFEFLIWMRALQGLTGGTPVIARAMVRDVSSGNEAARILAMLTAILTIATLIAPVFGSGLLVLFEWRAIFWALAGLGLIFLVYTVFLLEETGGKRRPERFSFGFVSTASRHLFSLKTFLIPMVMGGLTFAGYAAMLSVGAVLTETVYDVSPQAFGSLFALAAAANTTGAMTVRHLLKTHGLMKVNTFAVVCIGVGSVACFAVTLADPVLPVFWGAICLYVFAFGTLLPTSVALSLEPAGDMPGFATSLVGAIQMSFGAAGAALATFLFDGSHRAIPMSMAAFGLLTVATLVLGRKAMKAS